MIRERISAEPLAGKIRDIASNVASTIKTETGKEYRRELVEKSIRACISNYLERIGDDMLEVFTSPQSNEFKELTSVLERSSRELAKDLVPTTETLSEGVFAGNKAYSREKLSAMIAYVAAKGQNLYKTSLNKLLFYSDLSFFFLREHGISGAVYYNRPFGPVAEEAAPILEELIRSEIVTVDPRTQTLQTVRPDEVTHALSDDEKRVIDWVVDTFGSMTASTISDYSHNEKAYKFTRPNEPIAYAYAKFLQKLPPAELLRSDK